MDDDYTRDRRVVTCVLRRGVRCLMNVVCEHCVPLRYCYCARMLGVARAKLYGVLIIWLTFICRSGFQIYIHSMYGGTDVILRCVSPFVYACVSNFNNMPIGAGGGGGCGVGVWCIFGWHSFRFLEFYWRITYVFEFHENTKKNRFIAKHWCDTGLTHWIQFPSWAIRTTHLWFLIRSCVCECVISLQLRFGWLDFVFV